MRGTVSKGVEGYKTQFETERAAEIAKVRPADPAGYKLDPPKAFAGKVQLHVGAIDESKLDPKLTHFRMDTKDPMLDWWRGTCHKMGLGQEAFSEGVGAYLQSKMANVPDSAAEMKKLGDGAQTRIDGAKAWLKGNVTEATFRLFERLSVTADGVMAVEDMISKAGGPRLADGGVPPPPPSDRQYNEADLRRMMGDPRYWDSGRRDARYIQEVKDGWAKLKPGTALANSRVKTGGAAA